MSAGRWVSGIRHRNQRKRDEGAVEGGHVHPGERYRSPLTEARLPQAQWRPSTANLPRASERLLPPARRRVARVRQLPTPQRYKLSGGDKDQLRRYVDSKVEITGKIEGPAEAGTPSATASSSAASTGARTPETKTGQTLHIDSVHQLAPNCSK